MQCLPYRIVTPERKRHIADAATYMTLREAELQLSCGFNECDSISIVFFNASSHREDVRVENDVPWGESNFLRQNVIRARADVDPFAQQYPPALARRTP